MRRTLHIVDVDNLTGGPTEHQCVADEAAQRYRRAAGVVDSDPVVLLMPAPSRTRKEAP